MVRFVALDNILDFIRCIVSRFSHYFSCFSLLTKKKKSRKFDFEFLDING